MNLIINLHFWCPTNTFGVQQTHSVFDLSAADFEGSLRCELNIGEVAALSLQTLHGAMVSAVPN